MAKHTVPVNVSGGAGGFEFPPTKRNDGVNTWLVWDDTDQDYGIVHNAALGSAYYVDVPLAEHVRYNVTLYGVPATHMVQIPDQYGWAWQIYATSPQAAAFTVQMLLLDAAQA